MKIANLIAAGVAMTAGLAGGTATYLVAAQPSPSSVPPARTAPVTVPAAADTVKPQKPIVKLAPCKPPAVREGKACVTEVVETVVLPAPAAPASPAPVRHPVASSGDDDDHGSNGGHHGSDGDDEASDEPTAHEEPETEDEDHADEDDDGDEDHDGEEDEDGPEDPEDD